jgi:hypothetical protein
MSCFDLPTRATSNAWQRPNPRPVTRVAGWATTLLAPQAGLVGGVARAKTLSPAKRKAIAKKAAEARWRDKKNDEKAAGEKGKAK